MLFVPTPFKFHPRPTISSEAAEAAEEDLLEISFFFSFFLTCCFKERFVQRASERSLALMLGIFFRPCVCARAKLKKDAAWERGRERERERENRTRSRSRIQPHFAPNTSSTNMTTTKSTNHH